MVTHDLIEKSNSVENHIAKRGSWRTWWKRSKTERKKEIQKKKNLDPAEEMGDEGSKDTKELGEWAELVEKKNKMVIKKSMQEEKITGRWWKIKTR